MAALGTGRADAAAGGLAGTGVTAGGRNPTGAFCTAAGGIRIAAGATGSALANTRCGTTVAKRRLAKLALTTVGAAAPPAD